MCPKFVLLLIGKGKAIAKTKGIEKSSPVTRPKRGAKQLYKQWIGTDFEEDSDESSDEEDETFEGPNGKLLFCWYFNISLSIFLYITDSSEDDDDEEGVNIAIEDENSEDSVEDGEEEEDEEEDDDELDEDDGEDIDLAMKDKPGFDSGCTAVVALLQGNELYVANAGDSRCIVCRNGKFLITIVLIQKKSEKLS